MKKLFLSIIFFFATINISYGAVSWSGNTCTITGDATVAQINDCLTGSSNGIVAQGKTGEITVQLPADTQAWTSGISINMTNATYINVTKLTIQGAGTAPTTGSAESTVITANASSSSPFASAFVITNSTSKKFRLTNIKIAGNFYTSGAQGIVHLYGTTKVGSGGGFRIDHMDLDSVNVDDKGVRSVYVAGGENYGVIDHNEFKTDHMVILIDPSSANTMYAIPVSVGSADAVYVENNISTKQTLANWVNNMFCDGANGSRSVIRYNTITDTYIGQHGFDNSNRAPSLIEAYNNTIIMTGDDSANRGGNSRIHSRGGTWIVYNNTITLTGGRLWDVPIGIAYYRSASSCSYSWCVDTCGGTQRRACFGSVVHRGVLCTDDANCGGSAGQYNYCQYIDGHENSTGWPCRDQTGVMNTHTTTTYSNTYQLAHYPSLFWNNTYNGSYIAPAISVASSSASTHIQNNRDYCHHATTMPASCGGIATTYTPLVYPHPLVSGATDTTDPVLVSVMVSGQQACPTNPSNVAISLGATDNVAVTGVRCCLNDGVTCIPATEYDDMDVVLTNTSGITWGTTVSSACDSYITYNCRATDAAGNFSNDAVIAYAMADNEDTDAPTMSTQAIGADGRTVTFTFSEAVTIGTGGSTGFTLTNGDSEEIGLTYVSGSASTSLVYQSSVCIPSTDTFTAGLVYTQPANGIEDMAGNDLASFSGAGAKTVTNGSTQSCDLATSLFEHGESAPAGTANYSGNAVNLGVKFQTSTQGTMTHCWFYKIEADTGTHVCTVYRVFDGSVVGTVNFADESASGWQDQAFATALDIAASEDYIVTVSHPTGNWTGTSDYFSSTYTNGNLTATTSGTDYAGRYVYGASMAYPTNDSARNYWTDFTMSYAGAGGPWQCTVSRTGDGCMVTGSQVVEDEGTCSATVTLRNGWKATWGGTCPAGSETNGVYTTGSVTADCTLIAACTEQYILP